MNIKIQDAMDKGLRPSARDRTKWEGLERIRDPWAPEKLSDVWTPGTKGFNHWYHWVLGHSFTEGVQLLNNLKMEGLQVTHFLELMCGCSEMALGVWDKKGVAVTCIDLDPHYKAHLGVHAPELDVRAGDIVTEPTENLVPQGGLTLAVIGNQSSCEFPPAVLSTIMDKYVQPNCVLALNVPKANSKWDKGLVRHWHPFIDSDIGYTHVNNDIMYSEGEILGCFRAEGGPVHRIELAGFWYQAQSLAVMARTKGFNIGVSYTYNMVPSHKNTWLLILPSNLGVKNPNI